MKRRYYKWAAFAAAIVLFLLLGERATPIADRAIVVGLALDKTEEGYNVAAQILVPSTGEKNQNGSAIVAGRDETLSGALSKIAKQTGLSVSLSHCNFVIVGRGVMEGYVYTALDYLSRNAYLSENALLVGAERAEEILRLDVAFGEVVSFYAERSLIAYGTYKDIAIRTIKDFLISYYSHGGGNWLTVMKPLPVEKLDDPSEGQSESGEKYVFDLTESAVFKKGQLVYIAPGKESAGINYVTQSLRRGALGVDGEEGERFEFYILSGRGKLSFRPEERKAEAKIGLHLLLKEVVRRPGKEESPEDLEKSAPDERTKKRLEEEIAASVRAAFEHAREEGVDLFDCYGGFERAGGKKLLESDKEFFGKISLGIVVELTYE